jgi:polysaccharide pyruvyl transferase CsaB
MTPRGGSCGPAEDSPRPRVFLVGYYGVGNLGDELIRVAIEAEAEVLGIDIAWYANWGCGNDADPRAVRVRGRGLLGYLRACLAADRVVLGGGGILKDEGLRMPAELLATVLIARMRRVPVAVLAAGVGPFYTGPGRFATRAVVRLAGYRSVRDVDSLRLLTSMGLRRIDLAADPVFGLAASGAAVEQRPPDRRTGDRGIVVSVRPWFTRVGGDRWETFSQDVARAIRDSKAATLPVNFTALYWPRDRDAARDVALHLGGNGRVPSTQATMAGLVRDLQEARLAVVMRYHSLVLAAVAGCPVVAIAYEPKVAALADLLGVPQVAADDPRLEVKLRELMDAELDRPVDRRQAVDRLADRARRAVAGALGAVPIAEAGRRG